LSTGLRLRERRRAIFILVAACIPLILLTCRVVRAGPGSGPDIEVPGGRKISDHGGMDVNAQQSASAPTEGSVHIDETLSLAGMASGAGLAAARRMMMQRQQDEEEKRKRGPMGSGSSDKGSSSTKSSVSSATGFVGGRPFAQVEPPKAMPTSFSAQPIDKGASDDEAFPWHEVPGAFASTFASMPSGIWEGLKEDYGAWRAYFKDPTSVAPSNIAPYLTQFGYDEMGCRFKDINPEAGATVMAAVDFFGLGKIPFTGNLPRGLILESLKHGGGLEGLQEGFRYTSIGQVYTLASMALDPSLDEHLRAQCSGQLMAQGSLIAFSMLGSKLIPKVKSGLAEALDEIRTGANAQSLTYMDAEEFIWRQAMCEAVQDSNLEALAQNAEDLGELKSYYEGGELGLILKGRTIRAMEGHNIRASLRIDFPPSLIEAILTEEGPVQVEMINPITGKIYSFYKDFHKVEDPDIDLPFDIMNDFQVGNEVVLKLKRLPAWEFMNQIKGDASILSFNRQGVLVANLGGKEIPIKSLDYDYVSGREIGGVVYVESQVEDIYGNVMRFRVYDNGFGDQCFTMKSGGSFRPIERLEYDAKRDFVDIKYRLSEDRSQRTALFFKELPDEIDLDAGMATEEMIERVRSRDKCKMGEVGEEIAEKFVVEELGAKVLGKPSKVSHHGPDLKLLIDGEPGIVEAKLVTSESDLEGQFVNAISDVCRRFEHSSEYKEGVAFTVYFDQVTGHFEYVYRIITPETQDTAFRGLYLTKGQIADISQLGIDVGTQDQPPAIQSFAGRPINQSMSSNAQYSRQQTMFGSGQEQGTSGRGRQEESKSSVDDTRAQDVNSNKKIANTQDTVGVGSKQWSLTHSQSKDRQQRSNQPSQTPTQKEQQAKKNDDGSKARSGNKSPTNSQYKDRGPSRPSNQPSEPPTKVKQQEQGSKTAKSDPKKASVDDSSKTSKARDDGQQTAFEGREGSGKPMAQQAQQAQRQGQQINQQGQQRQQQGNNATKGEAKPASSDKNSKSDSRQGQQTQKKGSETVKDNEKPAPSNSNNSSKGAKDPDSRNYAPSRRSGAGPI